MKYIVAGALMIMLTSCVIFQPKPGGGFTIEPAYARADPGQVLKMVVSQAPAPIVWTVNGGTIAADGTFTAPGCAAPLPAVVTITATSGTYSATATVDVADKVTGVSISPPAVSVAPGATQKFTATVRTICIPGGTVSSINVKKGAVAGAK